MAQSTRPLAEDISRANSWNRRDGQRQQPFREHEQMGLLCFWLWAPPYSPSAKGMPGRTMRILPHCRRCQDGHGLGAVLPFAAREPAVNISGMLGPGGAGRRPRKEKHMNAADKYEVVVLGSGTGGKLMAGPWPKKGCGPLSSRGDISVARV